MIQLLPHLRILIALQPVDFRKGIDSLVSLCKNGLDQDPFSGTLFVFRNRSGTSLKLLVYDSQGFWLLLKRFSKGHIRWWPKESTSPIQAIEAQHLLVLIYNGLPQQADFSPAWRQIA
jgi:transposase